MDKSKNEASNAGLSVNTDYTDDYDVFTTVFQTLKFQKDKYDVKDWNESNTNIQGKFKFHSDIFKENEEEQSKNPEDKKLIYTSNIIGYKYPLAYVKIVRLDGNMADFQNNDLKSVTDFVSEYNRKALEWQIWFISSPLNESGLKSFSKLADKIYK